MINSKSCIWHKWGWQYYSNEEPVPIIFLLPLETQCICLQRQKDLFQPLLWFSMDKVSIVIKLSRRIKCVHVKLRLINKVKVNEDSYLTEMILWASPTPTSSGTNNCSSFITPNIWWSRCPIYSVLQRC